MTIFVQIASYRDPQLIPTIRDCLAKAASPENLRFCIAWQHDAGESISEFENHPQFEILDIPFQESRGACWARNQIQQDYKGETYTLALDSHHRFVPDWDEKCIRMLQSLQDKGHEKPLLTTYAPPFDPDNDPAGRHQYPTQLNFDRFIPEGAIFFRPAKIPGNPVEPIPSRFLSAHFIFTLGQFCTEVPHDPDFYFHGEEISLAVRAYTHGYDLFHPHEVILWHEYSRKGRPKHWDDHRDWGKLNEAAHSRNRRLLNMEGDAQSNPAYGLGSERTLSDYERYAGVSFRLRAVHEHTLRHRPLPIPDADLGEDEWEKLLSRDFEHTIRYERNLEHDDYDFWCIAYHDQDGGEIYRQDRSGTELEEILSQANGHLPPVFQIHDRFQYFRGREPRKWVVWPHSKSEGWCERAEGVI